MSKPLREITVGEWKALCDKRTKELREEGRRGTECDECPMSGVCANTPDEWDLPEESIVPATAKPRLAEVLGVEVGEKFRVNPCSCYFWIRPDGDPTSDKPGLEKVQELAWIIKAINHPESIIRAPRLTEAELERCRVYGAKWVSRDKSGIDWTVNLWREKPLYGEEMYNQTEEGGLIATIHDPNLFPSVHPGDCICVEEAGGDE